MEPILVIPGDGFGPSVIDVAVRTLEIASDGLELIQGEIGLSAYEKCGRDMTLDTLDMLSECCGVLCGPSRGRLDDRGRSHEPLEILKNNMGLYATMRRFVSYKGLGVPGVEINLWAGSTAIGRDAIETREIDGVTLTKYVRSSFYRRTMDLAQVSMEIRGANKIACISRDDIFPESSKLFREAFDQVFDYNFERTHVNVTEWAEDVVRNPLNYGDIICADLYSQMAAGVLAGLTGGNRLSPYCYPGERSILLYPSRDGDYDVKGYANPTAAIVSAALLMRNNGRKSGCDAVLAALSATYEEGCATPDSGGNMTTREFADRFFRHLRIPQN